MKPTFDINIEAFIPLITPNELKAEIPISEVARETVLTGRAGVEKILSKEDPRLLVIAGPCSIHDSEAALEYAERLMVLKKETEDTLFVIMRVYFEKPRTTVGWKGMINDPCLDTTCDMSEGLHRARRLMMQITEMGLPIATELLDPIIPQYVAGLIAWSAIGARTTESQTHREMASGLSMPVGFKNSTDGSLTAAINGIVAAESPQSFLGIDENGQTCIVKTTGNPWSHLVLRGGAHRPNYDPVSIEDAGRLLKEKGLNEAIMVDCSHDNSGQKHKGQTFVWKSVLDQRLEGNDSLIGMMLESNLYEGKQKVTGDPSDLRYGVSVTDECISWETTEHLLRLAHEKLSMC